MSVEAFCPVLNWISFLLSSLYILDTKPLSDNVISNIFSHSVDCLSISLMVTYNAQRSLILAQSNLSNFLFLLVCVYSVREGFSFILLDVIICLSLHLLKKLLFSH